MVGSGGDAGVTVTLYGGKRLLLQLGDGRVHLHSLALEALDALAELADLRADLHRIMRREDQPAISRPYLGYISAGAPGPLAARASRGRAQTRRASPRGREACSPAHWYPDHYYQLIIIVVFAFAGQARSG